MQLLKSAASIAIMILMSGCELHQVKGEVAGVEVEAATRDHDHDRGFCPPGQRKKENC